MPEMDGMELCRRMKADEAMQYTPVVFLTARNDLQAKIRGLEVGAEAFVEKPFSLAYLKALIFSIMDNRRKEREAFAKLPFAPVSSIKMNAADEEFIDKVIAIIHDNITDEQLGVEYLADKLCMNRSSLLRKIKSITNISAVDFIKVVRLKRAALMLREGRYRINEVCFAVGINSPSYFSKLFQQQFGMLPKEFTKN
jgi:AraC-like DNA-binding protein